MQIWFLVAAGVGLFLGGAQTAQFTRRFRSPYMGQDALMRWEENAVWPWEMDPVWGIFVIAHGILCVLAGFELLAVGCEIASDPMGLLPPGLNSPLLPDSFHTSITSVLGILALIGVAIAWSLAGSAGSYLLLNMLIRPLHNAITPDGIAFPMRVLHWKMFSYWHGDARTNQIRLYSARCPELATVQFATPTTEMQRKLSAILGEHLPGTQPGAPVPWHRQRWTLLGRLFLFALPLLAGGLWLYLAGIYWAWFYYVVIAWLITSLGYTIPKALGAV